MVDWECRDVVIYNDDGVAIYTGPRFLRCTRQVECGEIMTQGKLQRYGACSCGNRRFMPALRVLEHEQEQMLMGDIPLLDWERDMVEGKLASVGIVHDAGRSINAPDLMDHIQPTIDEPEGTEYDLLFGDEPERRLDNTITQVLLEIQALRVRFEALEERLKRGTI